LQLASDGIKREFTQGLFDQANYTYEEINGDQLVQKVKASLSEYFSGKQEAAQVINVEGEHGFALYVERERERERERKGKRLYGAY